MTEQRIGAKITISLKQYREAFKRMVVAKYECGILNKDELQRKYSIGSNARLLTWCRKFGKMYDPQKGQITRRPIKDAQQQLVKAGKY